MRKHCLPNRLFCQQHLAKFGCVGPIFTVLPITLSFLVRFQPVKYRIEALNMLYPMVRGWSAQSSFWSGQWLGQTSVKLGQPWSKLVKPPQTPEMCSGPRFEALLVWWAPSGSEWLGQTSVKVGQPWSNLVKVSQTSPNSKKCAPRPVSRFF